MTSNEPPMPHASAKSDQTMPAPWRWGVGIGVAALLAIGFAILAVAGPSLLLDLAAAVRQLCF
jgi:hypothetical protein